MKKLMVVRASFEYVILVDTDVDKDATPVDIGYDTVAEAFRDYNKFELEINVSEIDKKYLPVGWDKEGIPYNGDGNTPIKDYL